MESGLKNVTRTIAYANGWMFNMMCSFVTVVTMWSAFTATFSDETCSNRERLSMQLVACTTTTSLMILVFGGPSIGALMVQIIELKQATVPAYACLSSSGLNMLVSLFALCARITGEHCGDATLMSNYIHLSFMIICSFMSMITGFFMTRVLYIARIEGEEEEIVGETENE